MNKSLILAALLAIFAILVAQNVLAKAAITTPLYTITDLDSVPVEGLSKSTTIPNEKH